jgi:hypothetical protein
MLSSKAIGARQTTQCGMSGGVLVHPIEFLIWKI